jgi:hypothetical protein
MGQQPVERESGRHWHNHITSGQLIFGNGSSAYGYAATSTGPVQSLPAYITVHGGQADGSGGDVEILGGNPAQVGKGGTIYLTAGIGSGNPGTGGDGGDIVLTPGSSAYGATGIVKVMANNIQIGGETLTDPGVSGTFGLLEANQTWTGTNTFSKGTAATTTVNFGEMGAATSKVCFNTKTSSGLDMHFYFNDSFQMVTGSGSCQ